MISQPCTATRSIRNIGIQTCDKYESRYNLSDSKLQCFIAPHESIKWVTTTGRCNPSMVPILKSHPWTRVMLCS